MTSTAISAQGASISIDATDIENVVSFTGFDGEANELDTTNLASVAKERILGLQDFGSFSMEIHPDFSAGATGQNALRAAQAAGTTHAFIVTLPDTTTMAFQGLVKNATSTTGGVDAVLGGSVSLAVDGDVTITPPV